jgi:hypothetical protein
MTRAGFSRAAILSALPLLAACADMSKPAPLMVSMPAAAPETGNAVSIAQFVAAQRADAHRLDAGGDLAGARLHWRYVEALAPGDAEAEREIARLDAAIKQRVAQLMTQGETALAAKRTAEAQTDFLKILALDGTDQRARGHLRDLDMRAGLAAQDRKAKMAQAAKASGTESPGDE